MTIAMFSLIVFSLVMMATMNENYDGIYSSATSDRRLGCPGRHRYVQPAHRFTGALEQNGIDTSGFTATGTVTTRTRSLRLRMAGTSDWKHRCGV